MNANWLSNSAALLRAPHFLIGTVVACVLSASHVHEAADPSEPSRALVTLGLLALSVGMSLLAGYLLQKKNKDLVPGDKPTVLSQRGSYTAWISGIGRLDNVVFGWAGGRFSRKEKPQGGKGSAISPKVDVWYEDGWHLLGPGPLDQLDVIRDNGKEIFTGPITRDSHPSGSFIDLGGEGGFFIYWGEERQPVNTYLGSFQTNGEPRMGISSRWPFMCYVLWVGKRLGQQPNWSILDYTLQVRPTGNHLTMSDPWFEPTRSLDGAVRSIFGEVQGTSGYWELVGDFVADYPPNSEVSVTGYNLMPDRFFVLKTESVLVEISPPNLPFDPGSYSLRTRVFPVGGTPAGVASGDTIQAFSQIEDDGANIAHIWADLLFESWPRGRGLDKADWDMDSLETIGVLTGPTDEGLRCSLQASQGETVETVLGKSLQDIGVMLPINVFTGQLEFVEQRAPTGTVDRIRETAMAGSPPKIVKNLVEIPADRVVFAFKDRSKRFRTMTLSEQSNGSIAYGDFAQARTVSIESTHLLGTAGIIASRRAQEELSGFGQSNRVKVTRAGRVLMPGRPIIFDVFPGVMRIEKVTRNLESGCVTLDVLPDSYGIPKSTFEHPDTPVEIPGGQAEADLAFLPVEVPEVLLAGGDPTMIVPRIRANTSVSSAGIHLSNDNNTYTFEGDELDSQTGGTLVNEFSALECAFLEEGPEINILGPDFANVLDLSGDTLAWTSGRQLVAINQEIFFVRNVTMTGPTTARLDGLMRAMYGTKRGTHLPGANVFIFQNDGVLPIQDSVILQPNRVVFSKTAPEGIGSIPIAQVAPVAVVMEGRGILPPTISGLRVVLPYLMSPGYQTGQTLCFEWAGQTPQSSGSGAGMSGAGDPVGDPAAEGDFLVEILDASATIVVRTVVQPAASFQYDQAQRLSDLGGEVDFNIRVTQLRAGLSSAPVTLAIEAL